MLTVYASMVVFDTSDIRLSISTNEDAVRTDLIEFYNEMQESDEDLIDDDAALDAVIDTFRDVQGWNVIVEENGVWP